MLWQVFLFIGVAWTLQTIFGIFQIRYFNKRFKAMRKLGRVVIGKNKGRIRTGVVVLMAIDEDCNIIKAEKMQGISVFAKMKVFNVLENKNLLQLNVDNLKNIDKWTASAVNNGIENYKNYVFEEENKDNVCTN